MKFINDIKITKKIVLAFTTLLILSVGLGLFSLSRVRILGKINAETVANVGVSVRLASMRRDAADVVGLASQDALSQDGGMYKTVRQEEASIRQDFSDQWSLYKPAMAAGRDATDGSRFNAAFQKLATMATRVGKMCATGDSSDAGTLPC